MDVLWSHLNGFYVILTEKMGRKHIAFADEQIEYMVKRYRNGASSNALAREFGVSKGVILRCPREADCKIKQRGGQRIEFTDDQLEEIVEMYQEGHSASEIAEKFGVSKTTILRRLKEIGCKVRSPGRGPSVERDIPDPWADVDAAYVFGILIGDGAIQSTPSPSGIRIRTPDKEFVGAFSEAVESAFGIQANDHSDDECPYVEACSVNLGRAYNEFKWRKKTWRVLVPFFNTPRRIKVALCQGKFDSDGGSNQKAIEINAIHKLGLEDMKRIVESLGYKTTLRGPYTKKEPSQKDQYTLRICHALPNLFRLFRKKEVLRKNYSS